MKIEARRVASIFKEMANLLSIKGENLFRIRAYRKAADVFQYFSGDLEEAYKKGELNNVPGVGKGILEKIGVILKTGRLPAHEELKAEFPPGLMEILSIPEVGPKTVRLLYEKMGIESIDQLKEAIKKEKLRYLPGMGAKSEENILRGIKLHLMSQGRILLGRALQLVQGVIQELTEKASSFIDKISPAGSLRRGKETIGDIDILVTSSRPSALMDAFISLSCVQDVLARGQTKSSVLTPEGLQMDLRVVSPNCFGAAIQYFTGSKSHNIALRERAIKRGLKINEYGVFEQQGHRIAGEKEEEVYESLQLSFIPPELREDRGEIAVAEQGSLPELICEKDIRGDFHVHSTWSDGRNTIEELVKEALSRGYEYLAITDHSSSLKVAGGLSPDQLFNQVKKIRELDSRIKGFHILTGTEVDIKANGTLDFSDEVLGNLDLVIAALHTGFKQDVKTLTSRAIKAMHNPFVRILAHPSGRLLGEREAYAIDMERILEVAKEEGVWLEINAQPERLDLTDVWAREAGRKKVKLVINTDAHSKDSLGFMTLGVITARRGWLEKDDVTNALSWGELSQIIRAKRRFD